MAQPLRFETLIKKTMTLNRIKTIVLLAAALLGIFATASCSEKKTDEQAKYIFVMIGDGMGASHVAATESYLSYKHGKLGGEQLRLTTFPVLGLCTTYSADKNITCSSASGTAIACGSKTNNGMLGVTPEGDYLKSMAYELKEQGYKVGVLSSVPVNHATPASFYAHNIKRGNYYEISKEIPESGFEFFAGAGFLHFNGADGKLDDIDSYIESKGYNVCYGQEEFEKERASSEKVVICQESARKSNAGNYTSDGENHEDIRLGRLLENAIEFLGDEQPFFIACEGGEIDWMAHANKTMSMVDAILKFDEAIQVAYEFYLRHPDETLIIVTADHETGGIALGNRKNNSMIDWSKMEKAWTESGNANNLTAEENDKLNLDCNIGWTTSDHTGGPVPVYAIGKGSERFGGRIDNTDIFGKIVLNKK